MKLVEAVTYDHLSTASFMPAIALYQMKLTELIVTAVSKVMDESLGSNQQIKDTLKVFMPDLENHYLSIQNCWTEMFFREYVYAHSQDPTFN